MVTSYQTVDGSKMEMNIKCDLIESYHAIDNPDQRNVIHKSCLNNVVGRLPREIWEVTH
jgi:hypothetical protein